MILESYVSQKNHCFRKVHVQQDNVKHHSLIREDDVRITTNDTEHLQLNTLCCNTLLRLSKLRHHSSSTSLSYTVSSFNSMNKPLSLSFNSNISESKVRDMDNKVSACVNKLDSKL